jgi:hypothetical protein
VGQQVTLTAANASTAGERIDLLQERAGTTFTSKLLGGTVTECDLVAKVTLGSKPTGFLYHPRSDSFVRAGGGQPIHDRLFRALAMIPGQEITFTCVPPESGPRIAATP